ncbi:MAG: hypothetical protein J5892_01780 [Bacilli bacterium]|nr:hypothetical protein [Bacilli bacterium]
MRSKLFLIISLCACLLLVTGCENPVKKAVDNVKNKVEEQVENTVEEKGKEIIEDVKNETKKATNKVTGSDKLSCTMSQAEGSMSMNMKLDMDYDSVKNVPKNISVTMDMNVGSEVVETIKDQDLCSTFADNNDLSGKCTSSINGGIISLKYEIDESEMAKLIDDENYNAEEIKSISDLKKAFEDQGFTCK